MTPPEADRRSVSVRRLARLVAAALAGGVGGGVVGGLGARLAMWVVRLLNPSHDGEITHAASEVGRWTLGGTLDVVVEGITSGSTGGLLYLLVRPLLPARGGSVVRGLCFGLLGLALFGTLVLEVDYEFVRYVDPAVSVGLFAAVFPLAGLAVALLVDAIAPPHAPTPRRWLRLGLRVALGALAIAALVDLFTTLEGAYRF